MREYRFTGCFELATPLRLSSGEEGALADVAVRRRADGGVVVPGTSIAGAFRAYVERLSGEACKMAQGSVRSSDDACGCSVCGLFGDVRPGTDRRARASRMVFFDAPVEDAEVLVMDGVAIHRERRAASERRKFDFEQVSPGARLRVEVRGEELSDEEKGWIGAAFRALGAGRLPLGGRVAQGFGRLKADECDLSLRSRDTASTPAHLIAAVLNDGGTDAAWPEAVTPFPGAGTAPPNHWEVSFRVAVPPGATFLVADPVEAVATGFDRAPRGGASSPDLPATSLRGTLRSATERILRTLAPGAACDPTDGTACCAAREQAARRNNQEFERCVACRVFGNEEWASWVRVDVQRIPVDTRGQPFDHVAIDRFTGGAREGLKFDALAAAGAQFEVCLTAPELPPGDRSWVTGLLALALQDLHHGRWQVGYGSARGHGWFEIRNAPVFREPLDAAVRALWAKLGIAFPEVA